jgi:hypothetical protein
VTTQIGRRLAGRVPVTTDVAIPLSARRTRMLTAACRKPAVEAESNLGRSVEEFFDSSTGNPRTLPGLFLGGGFERFLGWRGGAMKRVLEGPDP